jgi:hypothetical protein
MIGSIHPMSLDLYGLSMSPPPPSSSIVPNGSSSSPPQSSTDHSTNPNSSDLVPLSTSIDSISSSISKQQQTPPVIYPWMRKVHINNPGKTFSFLLSSLFFFDEKRRKKRGNDDRQHG